jgi:hypothetical protein
LDHPWDLLDHPWDSARKRPPTRRKSQELVSQSIKHSFRRCRFPVPCTVLCGRFLVFEPKAPTCRNGPPRHLSLPFPAVLVFPTPSEVHSRAAVGWTMCGNGCNARLKRSPSSGSLKTTRHLPVLGGTGLSDPSEVHYRAAVGWTMCGKGCNARLKRSPSSGLVKMLPRVAIFKYSPSPTLADHSLVPSP